MVEGEYATMGFSSYLTKPPAEYNSVLVDMLLEGGAVLYCKTSLPQGILVRCVLRHWHSSLRPTHVGELGSLS